MSKSPFSQALTDLANSIRRYLEIRLNIAKLEVMEKSARILSLIIAAVFLLMLFMLFLLFASFAAAFWLGELLQDRVLGYLCVAGFYFLLGIILLSLRRRLFVGTVIKHLSEIFFEEKNKDSDEED
jgi:polyferredoxin